MLKFLFYELLSLQQRKIFLGNMRFTPSFIVAACNGGPGESGAKVFSTSSRRLAADCGQHQELQYVQLQA